MKKLRIVFLLVLTFTLAPYSYCQINQDQKEELSTIIFVRVSKYATHAMYSILDGDRVININEGINWFKYQCEPGEHLFWATNRDNSNFLTADLQSGKTYLVIIHPGMSLGKTFIKMCAIDEEDDDYERSKELILGSSSSETSEEDIFYKMRSLKKKNIIEKNIEKYESFWKEDRNYCHINSSFIIKDKELILLQ